MTEPERQAADQNRDGHYRLASGLHLTALRREGRTFAAALTCKGGFRDDPPGENGLNHLIEHLAFKCAGDEAARALSRRGVNVNGWTELERTVFWAAGPESEAETGIAFLLGMLGGKEYSQEMVAAELDVLEQEQLGRTYTRLDYERDLMYGNIVGTRDGWLGAITRCEELRKLPIEKVRRAGAALLAPENAWLTVVSPDPIGHVGAITQGSRAVDRPEPTDEPEAEPPPLPRCVITPLRKAPQTTIVQAFHYRPNGVYKAAPVGVMCDLLGGGTHAELFRALRDSGLAYDQGLTTLYLRDCAVFSVYASVNPKNTERALRAINGVLGLMRTQGFAIDAIEDSRTRMIHGMESLDTEVDQLCGFVAGRAMHRPGRPPGLPSQILAKLREMDPKEVNTTAAKVAREERCLTLVLGNAPWWRRKRIRSAAEQ